MTLPEVQLWLALCRHGLGRHGLGSSVRFRRQFPVGAFVLDFYAPAAKLAIEVDGAAHDIADQAARDLARDAWLGTQGIRVLRFNASDVLDKKRREDVLATIAGAIEG